MASAESSAETAIGHAHNAARMLKPNEVKGVLGAMMRSFSGESGRLSFGWRATRRKTKRDWLARNAIPGPMNANVQRGRMRSRGFVPQSRAVAGSMAQWGQRRKVGIGDAPRGISCFHAFLICLLFLSPPLCGHSSSGTKPVPSSIAPHEVQVGRCFPHSILLFRPRGRDDASPFSTIAVVVRNPRSAFVKRFRRFQIPNWQFKRHPLNNRSHSKTLRKSAIRNPRYENPDATLCRRSGRGCSISLCGSGWAKA
jgi:hypothetical protein